MAAKTPFFIADWFKVQPNVTKEGSGFYAAGIFEDEKGKYLVASKKEKKKSNGNGNGNGGIVVSKFPGGRMNADCCFEEAKYLSTLRRFLVIAGFCEDEITAIMWKTQDNELEYQYQEARKIVTRSLTISFLEKTGLYIFALDKNAGHDASEDFTSKAKVPRFFFILHKVIEPQTDFILNTENYKESNFKFASSLSGETTFVSPDTQVVNPRKWMDMDNLMTLFPTHRKPLFWFWHRKYQLTNNTVYLKNTEKAQKLFHNN